MDSPAIQDLLDQLRNPNLVQLGSVLLVALGAWVCYWLSRRALCPSLEKLFIRLKAENLQLLVDKMSACLGYLLAAIVLFVAADGLVWSAFALTLLAFLLAVTLSLALWQLLRLFNFGRGIAVIGSLVLFVASMAGTLGGLSPVTSALDQAGITIGSTRVSALTIVTIALVFVVMLMLVQLANRLIARLIQHSTALDPTQRLLVQKLAGIAVVVVAVFIGIDLLSIDLTSLAVFSGALGLAIGFGLQKTLGNLIAGLILLMDRSIKPGDVIAVGDSFGQVNKIGIRAVSVVTRDGKEHLIPNEILMTEEVENWSYSNRNVRVHISVGVSYNCDIHLAQKLMIQAALDSKRVLRQPQPSVWLRGFGDSSVDHDILIWITDPESGVGNIRSEILNRIWDLFKENGIEIPFPQRDVHIRTMPEKALPQG